MSLLRKLTPDYQRKNLDAANRIRMSNPVTIFDSQISIDEDYMLWDQDNITGSSSYNYLTDQGGAKLSVLPNVAGKHIRRTRRYINFQPAKSQLVVMAGSFSDNESGVTKKIGIFSNTDGYYFKYQNGIISVCHLSSTSGSPNETSINQSQWNLNKLDGSSNNISINLNGYNIYTIDYSLNHVRFGIMIAGHYIYCHEISFDNILTPPLRYFNMPLTYEIESDGNGGSNESSLLAYSSSVMAEGGEQRLGMERHISMKNLRTANFSDDNFLYPMISLRFKENQTYNTILLTRTSAVCLTNAHFEIVLVANPIFDTNVSDQAVWKSVPLSSMEYDITRGTSPTFNRIIDDDNVIEIDGYHVSISGDADNRDVNISISLGVNVLGVRDEIVLCVRKINNNGDERFSSSLTFKEIL